MIAAKRSLSAAFIPDEAKAHTLGLQPTLNEAEIATRGQQYYGVVVELPSRPSTSAVSIASDTSVVKIAALVR